MQTVGKQIKSNLVAIISLIVAITSLSYNSWRNEQTEANRNQRQAAFEILLTLNQLQQLVFHRHYDQQLTTAGNARAGWSYVLTIHDLSSVTAPEMLNQAEQLKISWQESWADISTNEQSLELVLSSIDTMRQQTLTSLKQLK